MNARSVIRTGSSSDRVALDKDFIEKTAGIYPEVTPVATAPGSDAV
jgi:hypothetical protein